MSSQLLRVASFATWPFSAAVSCLELARSGFRYSGHGESTVCTECHLMIDSWQRGDRPDQVHRQRSPNCPFVQEHLQSADNTVSTAAVGRTGVTAAEISSSSSSLVVPVDRSNPDFERLKDEAVRLSTFHDWPETAASIVDPRDLAKAGMFYTGQTDRVQCAFCRGYLRNWVQGDKPAEEHHKHFPDCPFVRNVDVGTLDVVDNMDLPNQVLLSSLGLPSLDTVNIFSRLYCAQV